ncbi:MAG: methionyl-tRNA formyltransferase [Chlamydiota bacterium]|jgi:methionyl-tRNA formyltransferase
MKIIFFGTSSFAAGVLSYFLDVKLPIKAIVTQPDRAKKRSATPTPTPVKQLALQKTPNIPLFQPEKASDDDFINVLKEFDADIFVVVAYGQILRQRLLDVPKICPINIHASLLPKYRGAAPMQRCLMDGVDKSGVTIIEMNALMDAGDILAKKEVGIDENTTLEELEKKLLNISAPLTIQVIEQLQNKTIQKVSQDSSEVTFAPKITKEEMRINWKESSFKIHNLIRSISPTPGAWTFLSFNGSDKKRVKILRSEISDLKGKPGEVLSIDPLTIGAGDKSIKVLTLQPEGKKNMPSSEWLRGIQKKSFTFI